MALSLPATRDSKETDLAEHTPRIFYFQNLTCYGILHQIVKFRLFGWPPTVRLFVALEGGISIWLN